MNKKFLTQFDRGKLAILAIMMVVGLASVSGKSVFIDGLGDSPAYCQNGNPGLKKAVKGHTISLDGFFTDRLNLGFAPVFTDCCNGSKVRSLTLQYTGDGCGASSTSQASGKWSCQDLSGGPNNRASVYIKVSEKADGSGKVYFTGSVSLNGAFSPSASTAGESKFPSNTYFNIYASQGGTLLQKVQIHTSCSTPIVIGDQFGSLQLQSVVFENGTTCNGAPPPPPPPPPTPGISCCEQGGKPKAITVKFVATNCGASTTTQASDKWSCSDSNGGPAGKSSVYVKASEKADGSGKVFFTGTVSLNGSLTANAASVGDSKLPANVYFNIYASQGGALLQRVKIHTSCSAPIILGEQFGSLLLTGVTFENGTSCGPSIPPPPPPVPGISCCEDGSKPKSIIVKFVAANCGASTTTQGPDKWSCSDSNGGPAGAPSVYVKASKDSNGGGGTFFAGAVALGESFTADAANAGLTKLPANTYFNIYKSQNGTLLQQVKIHTSCSAPLVLGEQFGSLVLVGVTFENGKSCAPSPPPPPDEDCPDPIINEVPASVCEGESVIFSAPDLGFPCLAYTWDFGANATPSTAIGLGPHSVTYSAAGSATVSLTIDNHCDGGTGSTVCTAPPGSGGNSCFKIDPPVSGSKNGVTYTLTNQNGEPIMLTVTGQGITSVEVKGGTGSLIYTTAPFTNLTAPINPNTGRPYAISHFTICTSGGSTSGGNGGGDCCDSNSGKPKSLTIQYTGEGCSATSTSQSTSKYSCANIGNGPNGAASVYIKASDREDGSGISYFAGNVSINGTFTVTAPGSALTTNTYFLIYSSLGGALLQKVKIHTSCSAPLIPGDQFGSLVLLSASWANGAVCGLTPPPGPDCIDCHKTVQVTLDVEDCTPNGKIGDFVFEDVDCDGRQDDGEPGIPNVPVKLLKCNGDFLRITVTDENGKYCFNDVPPGDYRVMFINPNTAVYEPAPANQPGVPDDKDSDAGDQGMTACFTLDPGENNPTIDAGFKRIPPPPCIINILVSNIRCDGKNTPSTADDVYFFDITVVGVNTSNKWVGSYDHAFLGAFFIGEKPYYVPVTLGPFPAGRFTSSNTIPPFTVENGLNINVSVNDKADANCRNNVTVVSPGPCSPPPPCDNITNGGKIGHNESQCGPYDPAKIVNIVSPSGGSGDIEYVWLSSTTGCPDNINQAIPGATGPEYDPGIIFETTYFVRCVRRRGCTQWIESNCVVKEVSNANKAGIIGHDESECDPYDPEEIVSLAAPSGGSGEIHYIWLSSTTGCPDDISQAIPGATGPTYDPGPITQTTWYVRCARRGDCQDWIESNCVVKEVSNVNDAGVIGHDESKCGWYDPEEIVSLEDPSGGSGDLHYIWLASTTGCPNSITQAIPGQTGPTLDLPFIFQTMYFVRCARRGDCQQWIESNCVVKEVTRCIDDDDQQNNLLKLPQGNTNVNTVPEIQLYPNPADGYATVTWHTAEAGKPVEIKLINQLGQTVKTIQLDNASEGSHTFGLDGLKAGHYALRFQLEGMAPVVKKLLVSH